MSQFASLVLSTGRTQVAPGGQVSLTATITSQSPQTEEFRLSLQGIDPAWITYRPPSVSVGPARTATITMLVRPPSSASSDRLRVVVSLISRRTGSPVAEAVVAINIGIPGGVRDERGSDSAGTIVAMVSGNRSTNGIPFWAVGGALLVLGALLVAGISVFHPWSVAEADTAGAPVGPASWAKTCGAKSTKEASLYAREDVTEIRLANADQTNLQVLRTEPASTLPALFDPLLALSAPERESDARLAYVTASNEMLDNAHIWYIDIGDKKKDRHKLADVPIGLWVVQPVWSHDNKSLAFVRLNQDLAVQNRTQLELWVVEVGGTPRRVAGLPELKLGQFLDHPVSLCWALDNRTLIFQDLTNVATQRVQAASTATAAAVSPSLSTVPPPRGAASVPAGESVGQANVATPVPTGTSAGVGSLGASATAVGGTATASGSPQPGTPTSVATPAVSPTGGPAAALPSPSQTAAPETAPQQIQIDVKTLNAQKVPLQPQATPMPSTDRNPLKPSNPACGVPVFSQNDPTWRYIVMETGQHYIGSYGCALTSATMIMNYYGTGITPSFLSACLGANADLLNWVAVAGCTKGQVQFVDRPDFSWPRIDALLATGRPVIVGLVGGPAGMHFVVVTAGAGGGDGANYAVIDPWDASTDKTLRYFTSRGYTPTWLVAYKGSDPNCATRSVAPVPLRPAGPEMPPPPAAATALALNANNPGGPQAPAPQANVPPPLPASNAPPLATATVAPVASTATPVVAPLQTPVASKTVAAIVTSSPALKPGVTPPAPTPSSASTVAPPPAPSAAPTASCPVFAVPSLTAEPVSDKLGLTTQVRVTWTVTGGCAPVAGTLTARYTYAKQPNERTYHVDQTAPPLMDTPPVPFPGGSFTITYTLTFYDSHGVSVSTTTNVAVKFAV